MAADSRPTAATQAAFLLFVLVAGLNFVAVRFSNFELPPFWGAALRFGAAALLFGWVVALRRIPLPRGPALRACVWYGLLGLGLGYAFVYFALVSVPAGMAAVVLAIGPLLTFLLAWMHRLEAFSWNGLAGAVVAAGGLAVVFQDQVAGISWIPFAALVAGALAFSQSGIVVKRAPPVDPFAMNAVGMAVGAALLLAMSLAFGEERALPEQGATWLAFAYLVTVGSFALFLLFLYVIRRWTASAVAYQFVLSPMVAVAAGAWLADESVTATFAVGAAVILAGVYVGALWPRRRPVKPG